MNTNECDDKAHVNPCSERMSMATMVGPDNMNGHIVSHRGDIWQEDLQVPENGIHNKLDPSRTDPPQTTRSNNIISLSNFSCFRDLRFKKNKKRDINDECPVIPLSQTLRTAGRVCSIVKGLDKCFHTLRGLLENENSQQMLFKILVFNQLLKDISSLGRCALYGLLNFPTFIKPLLLTWHQRYIAGCTVHHVNHVDWDPMNYQLDNKW